MNLKYIIFFSLLFIFLASANYDHKSRSRKISNCKQLRALRREKVIKQRIKLVADIDCNNEPFLPLNILFTKFDGNGHTIKNLNLRYNGKKKNIHQIGLFNSLASGAIVRNLTIVNVDVKGIRNVGVIAGNSHMAVVEHIKITSDRPSGNNVIGRSNKIGGLIGYAKDSTLNAITIQNTHVRGINKVGGVVGLFTGGQLINAANLGFKNSSSSVVEGLKSVGGIVGESSASNFIKVGIRRGVIFGQSSVGGIAGKVFDTDKADQLYVLKYVRIIYRSGTGNDFGGFFGSYVIEGDSKYTISNSYTKARIIGKENVGGLVGHLNMDTPDSVVTFSNLIMASPIKDGEHNGKLIGVLDYNSNTQTFIFDKVYYFKSINNYLPEIGVLNDAPAHNDTDNDDPHNYTKNIKRAAPVGLGLEYVDIVQSAINNFDQERIWCQDRLRAEQGFRAKHQVCRCGPYSQDYNGNCLCSSFTELSSNKSFCINSTGICTTPWNYGKKFVSASDNLFLEIYAQNVHFIENGDKKGNLVIDLVYTAQATAWTDLVVLGKKGVFIASLRNFLEGKGFDKEEWKQSLNKTSDQCMQQAQLSIPWSKVAPLAQVAPLSGDFLLRIYAHTNLLRKEENIILRDAPHGETAELITAVPVFISLNTSVTTNATLSAKFSLDFKVDCTYYVKSTEIDPSGTTLKVNIAHTITNPLSLDVNITSITVNGVPSNATVIDRIAANCPKTFDLDKTNIVCEQETVISIDLPFGDNCKDKTVALGISFDASCSGPNKLDSTVCQSVYNQVKANASTSVPATINFDYNFCPKIEDTSIDTKSFKIRQGKRNIKSGDALKSNHVLNGTIVLDVVKSVIDSSFESATIQNIYLYVKNASQDGLQFIDVTADCQTDKDGGFEVRKDEIQISFAYIPNIYLLTKLLKDWHTGLYFVVEIDVHYQPIGSSLAKKSSVMNSQIRLQLPTNAIDQPTTERTKSISSEFTIKDSSKVSRSLDGSNPSNSDNLKNFSVEKAQKISEEYQRETKRNELLMMILGGSFGITMFIILITIIVVVYNHSKSKRNIPLQTIEIK